MPRWDMYPAFTQGSAVLENPPTAVVWPVVQLAEVGPLQCSRPTGGGLFIGVGELSPTGGDNDFVPAFYPQTWTLVGGAASLTEAVTTYDDAIYAMSGTGFGDGAYGTLTLPAGSLVDPPFDSITEVKIVYDIWYIQFLTSGAGQMNLLYAVDTRQSPPFSWFGLELFEWPGGAFPRQNIERVLSPPSGGWLFSHFDYDLLFAPYTDIGTPPWQPGDPVTDSFEQLRIYTIEIHVSGPVEILDPHGTVTEPEIHTVRLPVSPIQVTVPDEVPAIPEPPVEPVEVCPK